MYQVLVILREPGDQQLFGMLGGTTDSHLSLMLVARRNDSFGRGKKLHKFLRNADFCLTSGIWRIGVSCGTDTLPCA